MSCSRIVVFFPVHTLVLLVSCLTDVLGLRMTWHRDSSLNNMSVKKNEPTVQAGLVKRFSCLEQGLKYKQLLLMLK